ncbi:MAG TPA: calcium-binding protein [Xanthobacteraceae bacterium]|nr:calcium-binding protein [Xanthobacteraceae bacterium]
MATVYGKINPKYNYAIGDIIDADDGVTNGNDVIFGTNLRDVIHGLDGNDVLKGGGGADKLFGGDGIDTAAYGDSKEGVQVSLKLGEGSGGTASFDKLYDIENLSGSSYDDFLEGDAGANALYGEAGNDVLKGAGGADKLFGGAGDDTLHSDAIADLIDGGAGNGDTADFSSSQGGVHVNLSTGYYNSGFHHQPVPQGTPENIIGIENVNGSNTHDHITGNSADNILFGNGGIDNIWGGGGNDTIDGGDRVDYLDGGSGDDLLTGGAGGDVFNFDVYGNGSVVIGHDIITDFADYDRIQFDEKIFSDFEDVQDHMQQVGNDVVITYDDGNSVTIQNTNIASLSANDFLFY